MLVSFYWASTQEQNTIYISDYQYYLITKKINIAATANLIDQIYNAGIILLSMNAVERKHNYLLYLNRTYFIRKKNQYCRCLAIRTSKLETIPNAVL